MFEVGGFSWSDWARTRGVSKASAATAKAEQIATSRNPILMLLLGDRGEANGSKIVAEKWLSYR
jgi:hypothetical protein